MMMMMMEHRRSDLPRKETNTDMTANRHRTADPDRVPHPWSTGRDSSGHGSSARAQRRRRAPLVAALAVTALLLSGARAVAVPMPEISQTDAITADPGTLVTLTAADVFSNAGPNARFTSVSFSTMDYYQPASGLGVVTFSGLLFVQAKTAADLNAMSSPPPSPFTVTADVKMTNDHDRTASGTLSFVTTYDRTADPPQPTVIRQDPQMAPPGILIGVSVDSWFDNAGTNPIFTSATFSTEEYFSETKIGPGEAANRLWVTVKTSAELNALETPPPSPFFFTADVNMTNDEGATATGTISYKTEYHRDSTSE